MIKYTLKCPDDHRFDSWFASAEAYDAVQAAGHLTCAICGASPVDKAVMAPTVRPGRGKAVAQRVEPLAPTSEAEKKMAELRKHIEDNSDYVGTSFAKEARAIHDGDAPSRAIYGEASGTEVKGLVDDGVPVAPLPFRPQRKVN